MTSPHHARPPRLARSPFAAAMGVIVTVLLVNACAVQGLSFVQDTRVRIVTPAANETVQLPFEVRWSADDVEGYFAVFFSRSPIRPGQTLDDIVPDGDPCAREPDCPDADWLADRNIYVVDGTTLQVDRLPDRRDTDRARDRHDLTIVLMDHEGRRVDESAFTREFVVYRER